MELALNLVWAVLAVLGLLCWLRVYKPQGESKTSQLVALGLLALVLFPVISVTDDFLAAQMPAETDTCVRRHSQAHQHTIAPDIAVVTRVNVTMPLVFLGQMSAGEESISSPRMLILRGHFIRPPPAV